VRLLFPERGIGGEQDTFTTLSYQFKQKHEPVFFSFSFSLFETYSSASVRRLETEAPSPSDAGRVPSRMSEDDEKTQRDPSGQARNARHGSDLSRARNHRVQSARPAAGRWPHDATPWLQIQAVTPVPTDIGRSLTGFG
jgi:hypothetical protein